jgi:hypothetical protein
MTARLLLLDVLDFDRFVSNEDTLEGVFEISTVPVEDVSQRLEKGTFPL